MFFLKQASLYIQVRPAQEGESILALDGKEYALKSSDLVIADAAGPVAIAGVMGGERSAVTASTKRVLLESASFKPGRIRATSRRLPLISDSSYRFERGVDPQAVDLARQRAVELMVELAGAEVVGTPFESSPCVVGEQRVVLRPQAIERVLGYAIPSQRVDEILQALGCVREGEVFLVPSYRPDLRREIDLIEELSRMEGMARVQATWPSGLAAKSAADSQYDREWELRRFLTSLGYAEWVTNSLCPRRTGVEGVIELINPLTEDYVSLRSSLLDTALDSVRHNLSYGVESLKAFEMGTVYREVKGRAVEEKHLVILGAGLEKKEHWAEAPRSYDYYTLKGVLEALMQRFPEIKISGDYGALPDSQLKAAGIKTPVFAVEMVLKTPLKKAVAQFSSITHFPAVRRDLAWVVDRQVQNEQILQAIHGLKIGELEEAVCFDLFQDDKGEKMAKEKKSLAYALTYRSRERTLTEKEVSAWQDSVIAAVQAKVGGVLR
jgi:phenylalanyl-tRNA synthetase beta chain